MLVKIAVWIEPWVSSKLVTWVCDKVCDNVTDSTDKLILFSFQLQAFNNKKYSYNSFRTMFTFDQKWCVLQEHGLSNMSHIIWVRLFFQYYSLTRYTLSYHQSLWSKDHGVHKSCPSTEEIRRLLWSMKTESVSEEVVSDFFAHKYTIVFNSSKITHK